MTAAPDITLAIAAGLCGALAGAVGVLGGGTGILPTALLAWALNDVLLAVAISKIAVYGAAIVPTALRTSSGARSVLQWEHAAYMSVVALTSLGIALVAIRLPSVPANIAGALLLLVVSVKLGSPRTAPATTASKVSASALLGLHAALLPGTGSLIIVVLQGVFGMSPRESAYVKPFAQLIVMLPAVAVYAYTFTLPVMSLGLSLAAGLFVGSMAGVQLLERSTNEHLAWWMRAVVRATAAAMLVVTLLKALP